MTIQKTNELNDEQFIQNYIDSIKVEMPEELEKQIKAHAYRKAIEIKQASTQAIKIKETPVTNFLVEIFQPLAAASKGSDKKAIERTSSGGEFCYKILPKNNQLFVTIKILVEEKENFENRLATIKIGTDVVLSEKIEDGFVDAILDISIDLNQPISVTIK